MRPRQRRRLVAAAAYAGEEKKCGGDPGRTDRKLLQGYFFLDIRAAFPRIAG